MVGETFQKTQRGETLTYTVGGYVLPWLEIPWAVFWEKKKKKNEVKTERIWKHFLQGACTWKRVCAFFQRTQRGVTYGCSWPTSVGVNYAIIHPNPATGKTLAKRESAVYRCGIHLSCSCGGEVVFKELPFPTLFLKGWPMTKITIHSILLLPPSSLLLPVSWTPGSICESWNVIHTSSLHHCLPFLISSPFPSFPPPVPPVCRGDRVIRMWAVVSYPIHFFFFFICASRGLILQSHILLNQSTFFRPAPCPL